MVQRTALQGYYLVKGSLCPCCCYEVVAIGLQRGHIVVDELAFSCQRTMVRWHHLLQLSERLLPVFQLQVVVLDDALQLLQLCYLLCCVFICLFVDFRHYLLFLIIQIGSIGSCFLLFAQVAEISNQANDADGYRCKYRGQQSPWIGLGHCIKFRLRHGQCHGILLQSTYGQGIQSDGNGFGFVPCHLRLVEDGLACLPYGHDLRPVGRNLRGHRV